MRTSVLVFLLLSLAGAGCRSTGQPPIRPASAPTFVAAWTAPGGEITTAESVDALNWRFRTVHDTTPSRSSGPALAHDGGAVWMLMWVHGPELQFKTGLGGSTGVAGITWEQQANVNRLIAQAIGSPALAYGDGRWVAVYRRAGNALFVSRSSPTDATSWSQPAQITIPNVTASSSRSPALVRARLNGNDVFVLAFMSGFDAMVTTSTDGLTWSAAVVVGACEKDPALVADGNNVYAVLARGVGSGYTNFVHTSTDAIAWTQVTSFTRGQLNATGPSAAFGNCTFVVTEIDAMGGNEITSRIGTTHVDQCAPPTTLDFTIEEDLRMIGGNVERVGLSGARTAMLYARGRRDTEAVTPVVTQSGLIDRTRPRGDLVSGKNTLVRARLKAQDAAGMAVPIDSAMLTIVDSSTGGTIATVPGGTIGSDDISAVTALTDGDDLLFFVPGSSIGVQAATRFDISLTRGSQTFLQRGVFDNVVFTPNGGIPVASVSYDTMGSTAAEVMAALQDFARAYPVVDTVGILGSGTGVRFQHTTGLPLPAQGGPDDVEDEFILSNLLVGSAPNASNVNCASDAQSVFQAGRFLATNFTFPEDLDGDGSFSQDEVDLCADGDLSDRFDNMVDRFDDTADDLRDDAGLAFPSDRPKFGLSMLVGDGGTRNQSRVSNLTGQCAQGLSNDRLCWVTLYDFPLLHHEMGHAFGLSHIAQTATIPGPAYDLLNRRRVMTPQPIMLPLVNSPNRNNYFLSSEFDRLSSLLRSPTYINLGRATLTAPSAFAGHAGVQQSALKITARLLHGPKLKIISTRVLDAAVIEKEPRADLRVRLFDAGGRPLGTSDLAVSRDDESQEHAGRRRSGLISALVPFPRETTTVVFEMNDRELARLAVSRNAPSVRWLSAAGDDTLRWTATDADGDKLTYDVVAILPDGRERVVALNTRATSLPVAELHMPGGRSTLRVTARDGFREGSAELPGVNLPNRKPEIVIAYPANGARFSAAGQVFLRAAATDDEDGMIPAERIRWTNAAGAELGRGATLLVGLKRGRQVIRATATDASGAAAHAEVEVAID